MGPNAVDADQDTAAPRDFFAEDGECGEREHAYAGVAAQVPQLRPKGDSYRRLV